MSVLRARIVAFLVPLLVTLPRFRNGFVFDDVFMIVRGDFIHDVHNLPRAFTSHAMIASSLHSAVGSVPLDTYRPLSIASFFWDAALSGRAPWAYHATNALLHALCTLLVQVLLGRLVPALRPGRATLLACLFGLSPWLCEAHVFINGRSDLFLAGFALSALLIHQRALTQPRPALAWLTALLVLLGLLAKETMVMALPLVWLVPVPAAPAVALRTRVVAALPTLAALAAYLVARTLALEGLRTHADGAHLRAALQNLPLLWLDTLTHAWLPTPYVLRNLRDDYATASTFVRAASVIVLLASLAAGAWALARQKWVPAWALTLAFVTSAPAVMITTELWQGFGRYLYLPAVGVVTLLAAGLVRLDAWLVARAVPARARALVSAMPVALCLLGGALTVDATLGFRDERTLYTRALAARPEHAWPHGALGMSLRREGRCVEAIPLLAHADQKAPREPRYAVHLARCLIEIGDLAQARALARAGQRRFHDSRAEAGFLVAEFLTLAHGDPAAEPLMARCLALVPDRADCLEGLALARGDRLAPERRGR